ncbi:ketopantoate reductase family protein [Zhouia amylolytica]|uniref:ketopantoate reductase family protein n=1 Tax=Zhouia amylolytica TaxID=376730 RepID=UPI0020CED9D2|nr:2-dehydropantoate 2-reductase [Zhouia amylolytica]MCQ0111646.1 2-dehydropantoate 2-reductase [Zhouia amylolytica]
MNKKNIAIVGLGGVGGYFGFKINQRNEELQNNRVSFIARERTYKTLKENGLRLHSPEHQNTITSPDDLFQSVLDLNNPDLVLICVKEYDLESVCRQLSKVISKDTILLPLMNGANIYDRIRAVIPENVILPSCVYVASHIREKGIIEHKGRPGKLIFGKDPEHLDAGLLWVNDLMKASGIDYEFKDDPLTDIWTKFIFITSFGMVTAKYNSSIGTVCCDSVQKAEATEIMKEVKLIAAKKDIFLPDNIIEQTFDKAATFPKETPTSLQLDVNSGKDNTELELFAGAIVTYGKELNIETPVTQRMYAELQRVVKGV